MADKPQSHEVKPGIAEPGTPASTPRVSGAMPTQRGLDPRDAMAEMAERAQVIGQEAGTKVAAAMKDVLGAAVGIAGFAVESARDLVQYMVRRGQMTQDDADRLIRAAEDTQGKRGGDRPRGGMSKPVADRGPAREAAPRVESAPQPTKSAPAAKSGAAKKVAASPAAAKPAKKTAPKAAADKKAAKKPSAPKKRR